MQFQFDSNVAEKYGVESAVLINNLAFWIKKNAANNKHFYDGKYWTYNSVKAFASLFPFWNYDKTRRLVENLQKSGAVVLANYNENTYDRTSWYTITDEVLKLLGMDEFIAKCIWQNCQMEMAKLPNGNGKVAESYIGTDNKTDNKTDISIQTVLGYFEFMAPDRFAVAMMQHKSKIKDFERFKINFECKFIEERLQMEVDVIENRFRRMAANWTDNVAPGGNKGFGIAEVPDNHPSRKKIG